MSCKDKFFQTLFKEGDGICYGNFYETRVIPQYPRKHHEFFSINPLDSKKDHAGGSVPRRADLNVTEYRSFLFEMDGVSIDQQTEILNNCGIEFTSIVFSGKKSLHAILSLQTPLNVPAHTNVGLARYKSLWRKLAAKIDACARSLGHGSAVIDQACSNPSRFSRFPDYVREGVFQKIIYLGNRMSEKDFNTLLASCPNISDVREFKTPVNFVQVETEQQFWKCAPQWLQDELKYVPWASSENCYKDLYRVTRAAIDFTGVDYDVFLEVLNKFTFDKLAEVGYPKNKWTVGVKHAFRAARKKYE